MTSRESPYGPISEAAQAGLTEARSDPAYVLALERTLSKLRAAYAVREAELVKAVSLLSLKTLKARALVCGIAKRIDGDQFLRSSLGHPARLDVYLDDREPAPNEARAHAAMARILEARELQPELGDDIDMQLLLSFRSSDLKPDLRNKMEFYPPPRTKHGEMEFAEVPSVRDEVKTREKHGREHARDAARQAKLKRANVREMRDHDEAEMARLREAMKGKSQEEVRKTVRARQAERMVPLERQVLGVKRRV